MLLTVEVVAALKRAANPVRKVVRISAGLMAEGGSALSRRAVKLMRGGESAGTMVADDDAVSETAAKLTRGGAGVLFICSRIPGFEHQFIWVKTWTL